MVGKRARLRQGLDFLCKATGDPKVCGVSMAVETLVGYPDPQDPVPPPGQPGGRPAVKEPPPQLKWMFAEKSRPGSRGTRVVDMAEAIAANYLQSMVKDPMMVPHGVPRVAGSPGVRVLEGAPPGVTALQLALGGGVAAGTVTKGVIEHFRQRGGGGGRYFRTWDPRAQTILRKRKARGGSSLSYSARGPGFNI